MKLIRTEEAVGHVLCHDLTQIIKDQYKDARFRKGHVVTEEDIPVLLSMGKEHLYVWEMTPGMVHENDAAERLLTLCENDHMTRSEVKEGKIELKAACDGLFRVNSQRLMAVNSVEDIMIATRHGNTAVRKGSKLAGMRVIPLIIEEEKLRAAERAAGDALLHVVDLHGEFAVFEHHGHHAVALGIEQGHHHGVYVAVEREAPVLHAAGVEANGGGLHGGEAVGREAEVHHPPVERGNGRLAVDIILLRARGQEQ